ncbi:MAG: hypothetical protein V1800_11175, partial [Candidatus Latescibacterota bacterium]
MKTLICIGILLLFVTQISFSQNNQLRTLNEVVFSFYKPWDDEKLNLEIAPDLLHEDIDLFVKTIEEIGVNPYLNFPKDSFYLEIGLLKREIDRPLTRHEFLQVFVPICNDLKLSHTSVSPDYWIDQSIFDKKGGRYFPVSIKVENSRLFVDKDYSPVHLASGDEIISLNNINSKQMIDSLLRYSKSSTLHSRIRDVQDNFSFWLWWVYNFA